MDCRISDSFEFCTDNKRPRPMWFTTHDSSSVSKYILFSPLSLVRLDNILKWMLQETTLIMFTYFLMEKA